MHSILLISSSWWKKKKSATKTILHVVRQFTILLYRKPCKSARSPSLWRQIIVHFCKPLDQVSELVPLSFTYETLLAGQTSFSHFCSSHSVLYPTVRRGVSEWQFWILVFTLFQFQLKQMPKIIAWENNSKFLKIIAWCCGYLQCTAFTLSRKFSLLHKTPMKSMQ